jgi:uncharacterized integral membrane protein
MGILKGAFFLLLLAAGIGFAIQNDQPISLRFFWGWESPPLPLFLWAFLSLFIGLILSGLMSSLSKITLHSQIRQQKKAIAELERKRNAMKAEH